MIVLDASAAVDWLLEIQPDSASSNASMRALMRKLKPCIPRTCSMGISARFCGAWCARAH